MSKKLKNQRKFNVGERLKLPINMIVEVTNACNHECIFCAHSKMKRKIGKLDFDLYKKIIEQAYAGGTREIGFYMTGEPLIHNQLEKYVSYAKELGFEYLYITTNGSLASLETMKKILNAGINSIKFSINAGTAETYRLVHGKDDFYKVIENLKTVSKYIRQEKLDVGLFVTCIVCKQNKDEIEILKEMVREYVDDLVAPLAYNQGGNMYEINENIILDKNYKPMKAPCSMIFNRMHITCEGYLNACCVDFDNYMVVGDLNKVSLEDAWNSEKMLELRRMHMKNNVTKDVMCYNCINNSNFEYKVL